MKKNIAEIVDRCLIRLNNGETIDECLAGYPDIREQLEPLLDVAMSVSNLPEVSPSDEFREASKVRLMARIRSEATLSKTSKPYQKTALSRELVISWRRFWHAISSARKIAIPAVAALLVILIVVTLLPKALGPLSPTPVLASQCTLSVLGGNVELRGLTSDTWLRGNDGTSLAVGTSVKTGTDSNALLTFFDGSTTKLEPETIVEIQQADSTDEQPVRVVLKQWLGVTWNNVEKTGNGDSRYVVETPSASVSVRGTSFAIEVDETGLTEVTATEGLVSVAAEGTEVQLSANQQAQVMVGSAPSLPKMMPAAKTELIVTTSVPAIGSVRDPSGSSTGYLVNGLSFNQIKGSRSSLSPDGTQIITINEPKTGEYLVALRYIGAEEVRFNIQAKSGEKAILEHNSQLIGVEGDAWLIRVNVRVESGLIVSAEIDRIEPLGEEIPEKVVVTDLARKMAVPIEIKEQSSRDIGDITNSDTTIDKRDNVSEDSATQDTSDDEIDDKSIDSTDIDASTSDTSGEKRR